MNFDVLLRSYLEKSVPLRSETKFMKTRKAKILSFFLILPLFAWGQEYGSVFNFLGLPTSSHTTSLGGKNISVIDDDLSMAFQNPALLANVSDNSMNLNFMTYMRGSKTGSAAFSRFAGERGTWGAGVQFVGYGSMKETLETGEIIGDVKALDMAISGMYTYNLSDRWSGGATGKIIYSKYANYTSCALAVDLGLNYYDEDNDFSFSAVSANMGGQVKAFGDDHERLPYNLQLGFTKGLGHAPIRISVTMTDLTRWNKKYYYHVSKEPKGGSIFMNHFSIGIDVVPTNQFYIAAGYNFRRAYEMKAGGSSRAAGLSFGAGINLKKFKFGVAYAKYHVSSPTLAFSASYSL